MRFASLVLALALVLGFSASAAAQCAGSTCPPAPAGWTIRIPVLGIAPMEPASVRPLERRLKVRSKVVETERSVRSRTTVRETARPIGRILVLPRLGIVAGGRAAGDCGR